MAFNRKAIRERMAATIKAGLSTDMNAYPYVKGVPQVPCVIVVPAESYFEAEPNLGPCVNGVLNYEIWFLYRTGPSGEGQMLHDTAVDEARDALEADAMLGGLGGLTTGADRYRQRMQWDTADGQAVFDWGVLEVAVRPKRT